jgi:DNA invertase Pin-like site-specific DNA recombinase
MRYVAYEPRTATFETLALRTWLKEGRAPNQDRKIRKALRRHDNTGVVSRKKNRYKSTLPAADESRRRRSSGRRCLSLSRALDDLDTGDELVIAGWDRATRSMWDGLEIIKAVIDAGGRIKVLDCSYTDLATPLGRGFMAMTSAMAEDERLRIIKRTHEGSKDRAGEGVRMGRKPKLTPHQKEEARRRIAKGETTRELAKSYRVSISTISRLAA